MVRKRMKYDKLVRDRIPEIIRKEGRDPVIHTARKKEYMKKLKEKLIEESREFQKSGRKEELADILEVINAVAKAKKTNLKEIERIRKKKQKQKGAFKNKTILETD